MEDGVYNERLLENKRSFFLYDALICDEREVGI